MGLTSTAFQVLTVALAAAATLGALLLWNRVRGPRPVRLLSRVGLLLAGYGATAVAALVAINIAYGGLIANWGDVFADPNAGFHLRGHHPGHFPPGMRPPAGWPGGPGMPGGPDGPSQPGEPGGPGQPASAGG